MSATAKEVLDVARKWLGYSEGNGKHREIIDLYNSHTPLAGNYYVKYTDAWCDTFVSAVAIKASATDIIGTECGCERHVDIFKNKGIWIEDGSIAPIPGDIIVWNWDDSTQPNDGWSDHIGYVESVSGSTITTIEGNSSNTVSRNNVKVGSGYIRGFARPKYDGASYVQTATPTVAKPGDKTVEEVAKEVLNGKWGNGEERRSALSEAGYNYNDVQNKVNEMSSSKNSTGSSSNKSIDELAKEVILGKWGNGSARKEALSKAGYDYNVVQKKVNELL